MEINYQHTNSEVEATTLEMNSHIKFLEMLDPQNATINVNHSECDLRADSSKQTISTGLTLAMGDSKDLPMKMELNYDAKSAEYPFEASVRFERNLPTQMLLAASAYSKTRHEQLTRSERLQMWLEKFKSEPVRAKTIQYEMGLVDEFLYQYSMYLTDALNDPRQSAGTSASAIDKALLTAFPDEEIEILESELKLVLTEMIVMQMESTKQIPVMIELDGSQKKIILDSMNGIIDLQSGYRDIDITMWAESKELANPECYLSNLEFKQATNTLTVIASINEKIKDKLPILIQDKEWPPLRLSAEIKFDLNRPYDFLNPPVKVSRSGYSVRQLQAYQAGKVKPELIDKMHDPLVSNLYANHIEFRLAIAEMLTNAGDEAIPQAQKQQFIQLIKQLSLDIEIANAPETRRKVRKL